MGGGIGVAPAAANGPSGSHSSTPRSNAAHAGSPSALTEVVAADDEPSVPVIRESKALGCLELRLSQSCECRGGIQRLAQPRHWTKELCAAALGCAREGVERKPCWSLGPTSRSNETPAALPNSTSRRSVPPGP